MKYKSYPEYKETEIECIAEIPKNWVLIKLKYILSTLQSGKRENLEIKDNDAAFSIGGEHLNNNGTLKLNKVRLISKEFYNSMNSGKIQNGDILLVKDGATIGKTALISKKPYKNMAVNEHVFILRPNNKINSLFLYYLISGVDGFEQIKLTETGSAQGGINTGFTDKVWFSMPEDKNEIDFISNFLDKKNDEIDKLIEKDKKLIELLHERRTALINHVVTKGLNPNARMKDSGIEWIGKIPEGWEIDKMKNVADVSISNIDKKSKPSETDILLCNYIDVYRNDFINNPIEFMKATASHEQIKKLSLFKNDILITKDSETPDDIAVPALVLEDLKNVVCGYHLALLRPNQNRILGRYLFRALQSKILNQQFTINANGITRFGISTYPIKNSMIVIPSIEEQQKIANYLDEKTSKIDSTIQKIQQKINLLEEYKKSLIHHVVTGKVDVRSVKV